MNLARLTAAVLLFLGAVFALDAPPMKEGYWSIHQVTTTSPGNKKTESARSICRSHEYDQYVRENAKKQSPCKTVTESNSGGAWISETECDMAGTVVKSKSVTTKSGENAAHTEVHATYTPAMHGMAEMTMVMDQKYMGACPAGVVPGDMVQPDGTKVNTWKH